MGPREAFKVFIRFQLKNAVEEGVIDLTPADIERIASGVEDEPQFYSELNNFLAEHIDTFGENYVG